MATDLSAYPGTAAEPAAPRARRALRSRWLSGRALGTAYAIPAWIFMLVIGVIPIGYAVWLSLTNQSEDSVTHGFIGFRNYQFSVFTGQFGSALLVTLFFVVVNLAVQMVVGYLLAVALHRQVRGFRIARTALLIPMLLTPVAVGLMWQFMFNPDLGIIGFMLGKVGLHLNWLDNPWLAKFAVVIVDSWMNVPFVMLMVVAGMASLPTEPQEAAAVDGASWWATTRYVVIPQLKPVLVITLLVRCVDIVRLFDIIYTTTQGGPGTATQNVSLIVYNDTFQFFQTGQGAAMAVTLGLLMFPVYFLYVRLTRI